MITLKDACRIAKKWFDRDDYTVYHLCCDLGDSWAFEEEYREEQYRMYSTSCDVLKVYKETGKSEFVYAGLPGDKFFDELMDAEQIDIAKYLEELTDEQRQSD